MVQGDFVRRNTVVTSGEGLALPLFGVRGLLLAFILSFVLCWPIWLTGGAFIYSDTASYINAGEAIWDVLIEKASAFIPSGESVSAIPDGAVTDDFVVDEDGPKFGRSIFYSSVAYPLVALAGPTGLALFHGTFTLLALFALLTRETLGRPLILAAGFIICAAVSTLPWHTVYLMPDILSATLVIFAAVLVSTFRLMSFGQKLTITVMAVFAAGAHYGNMPLAGGLAMVVLALALFSRQLTIGVFLASLALAAAAPATNMLASRMILEAPSAAPLRLPILLARFLEDGTAVRYLEEHCPEAGYAMCTAFDGRFPPGIKPFLWDDDGIRSLDADTMQRIREEEIPLLKDVFLAYPFQQTGILLWNSYRQLTGSGTDQIDAVRWTSDDCSPETCRDLELQSFVKTFDAITPITTYGSAILLALLAITGMVPRGYRLQVVVLVAALLGNAAIFGGLSSPADRYQARLIWLVPAMLTIIVAAMLRRRDERSS